MPHDSTQRAIAISQFTGPSNWLQSALQLVGSILPFPSALNPLTLPGITAPGVFGSPLGAVGGHRRRRKRALTQSDRNDIAFIAATISKAAAGTFAVQLASRSR